MAFSISRGPLDLRHTDLVRHGINLLDNTPFKEPFHRISPAIFEEVREHISEMLEAEAIRPYQSPFPLMLSFMQIGWNHTFLYWVS